MTEKLREVTEKTRLELYLAEQAYSALRNLTEDQVKEARRLIMINLQKEYDAANEALRLAREKVRAEQMEVDDALRSDVSTDSRIGVVYCEWKKTGFSHKNFQLTGNRGICEVATKEHNNLKKFGYGDVRPGKLVVRYLKKDGTLSKVYQPFMLSLGHDKVENDQAPPWLWYPEGQAPDKK